MGIFTRLKTRLFALQKIVTLELMAIVLVSAQILPFLAHQQAAAVADVTAPVFSNGSIESGAVIDTVETTYPGYNTVIVNMHITDDISGNVAPLIYYTSPSGHQTATGGSVGTSNIEDWSAIINFPQYSEAGVWSPTITLQDLSLNQVTYTGAQLTSLGSNLDVTVTGTGDTADPSLTSMARTNPGSIDISNETLPANIDIAMTDNLSGLGIPTLSYTSPSGNQVTPAAVCNLASGSTQESAVYNCDAYFAHHSETGIWTPELIITDGAGNTKHFTNANLLGVGIDARVTIVGTGDTTPPTLNDVTLTFANPPADDIPYGGAVLTLSGNVSDDLTGLNSPSHITYTSPTGKVVTGGFNFYNGDNTFVSNVYLPVYSEGGTWQPSIHLEDVAGNDLDLSTADLVSRGDNLAVTVTKNITEVAAPGATVTSDYENDGATVANPVEASVTTPTGGNVSIVIINSENINDPTNGYTFFGRQVSIVAPVETVEAPLTLAFRVDSSVVPAGQSASTMQITRNGVIVPACADQTTATPNPCIFLRATLGDGDIQISVHTTAASAWASGFPSHSYNFKGFDNPVEDYPASNSAQAGQVKPIKFAVDGAASGDVDILASGQPVTQQVNCTTQAEIGSAETALSSDNLGLKATGKKYSYDWRTNKAWKNTCRVFSLKFKDNSVQKAFFKF